MMNLAVRETCWENLCSSDPGPGTSLRAGDGDRFWPVHEQDKFWWLGVAYQCTHSRDHTNQPIFVQNSEIQPFYTAARFSNRKRYIPPYQRTITGGGDVSAQPETNTQYGRILLVKKFSSFHRKFVLISAVPSRLVDICALRNEQDSTYMRYSAATYDLHAIFTFKIHQQPEVCSFSSLLG
ncbi:hypothetical protein OG21DRAFT_1524160 [Imleria badia]|nr:hypothetical protein OG21DRAFT_1524160 [Imleria badia]